MKHLLPRTHLISLLLAGMAAGDGPGLSAAERNAGLRIAREANELVVTGDALPGPIKINYMEAYCRPNSTHAREPAARKFNRKSELVSATPTVIQIRDRLDDGTVFDHTITAAEDTVDFRVRAHNPTPRASLVIWAQPCMSVDVFTGQSRDDMRALVPAYVRQCFLFIDGRLAMMPTQPWAGKAIHMPGQAWVPAHVSRDDANPRPHSTLVPSCGLVGCFSRDGRTILATAWEPYQEVFQGVRACLHSDFRIGGLQPGETKNIRGKIYVVPSDVDALVKRFERDFPEQARKR